ncbi:MAG: DUF2232 domain-containing protein [Proteobacteria bacterium]|nr:DUF2232 domain-containing protein [Pseudomonadota bacterium]
MNRQVLISAAGGLISAVLAVCFLVGGGGSVIFVYLSLLPILLVGLSLGYRAGTIALIAGVAGTTALAGVLQGTLYAAIIAVPGWIVIRYSLMNRSLPNGDVEWFPVSGVLARLTAIAAGYLSLLALAHFDAEGGFSGATAGYLEAVLSQRQGLNREDIIQQLIPLAPASLGTSWLVMVIVNATLAQGILVRMDRNLRPSPRYSSMVLPDWLNWAIVGAAILALAGGGEVEYVARNLVVIFATPFFLVGLGIVHLFVRRLSVPGMALTLFYIFLLFGWPIIAVAGLGFVEQWTGLRQRFGGPAQNTEEDI